MKLKTMLTIVVTISLGEPEWAGPADGSHQGNVCQEAGDDEEDELCGGMNVFRFFCNYLSILYINFFIYF